MKSFRFLILLTFIFAQLSLAISSIVMAGPLQLRGFRDPQSEPQIFIIEVPTKYRTPQQERLLLEALAHLSGYKKHLKVTFSRTRIEFDTYVVSFAANSSVQAPYRIKDMVPWPIQIRSIKDIFLGNRSHTPGPLPIMKMDAATLLETYKKSALEERVALMRSLSGTVLLSPTKSFHIRSGIPQKIEEVKEELTEIIDLTLEQIGKISTSIDQLVSRDVLSLDRKNLEDTLRTGLILRHTIMPFTNKASRNEIAAVTTAQFQFFSFLPIAQQKIYFRKLLNKYFSRPNTQPSIDSNAFAALAAKDRNERLALSSEVLRVWQVLSPERVLDEAIHLLSVEKIDQIGGATEKLFRERVRLYLESSINIIQSWVAKQQLDPSLQHQKEHLLQNLMKVENTYNWFDPAHTSFATDLAQMSLKIKTSLGYGYGLCVPVFRTGPAHQQNLDF